MGTFTLWKEALIFASIYGVIILVPCLLVALMGRKMLKQIGQYPTRTPAIQMGIFLKLFLLEACAFGLLIGFYLAFTD